MKIKASKPLLKKTVKKTVLKKSPRLSELVEKVFEGEAKDQPRAMRNLYLAAKADLSSLNTFKKPLLRLAGHEARQNVRWYFDYMVPALTLTSTEKEWARGLFTAWYENSNKNISVKTLSLQALFDLAGKSFKELEIVEEMLSDALKDPSPAVRARARLLLKSLSKI